MHRHRELFNLVLAVCTLVVLVATVVMLGWVALRYSGDLERAMDATERSFRKANVLKDSNDIAVSFSEIEHLAAQMEAMPMIKAVYVEKNIRLPRRKERVLVHPFYYAGANPDWQGELADFPRRKILQGIEVAGTLYFDLDTTLLRAMQAAIAVISALIVLTGLALITRIFTQERVLSATTQILEENQRELIRMERLALAGQLTANIFHDIRKPITNIKHEVADLGEALGGFAGASRSLKNMRDQTTLFFDILRDLNLERFVRSDSADEEYVDVNRVLEQSLRLVQYERGSIQLSVTLTPGLPLVLTHPYRLVQVFSNMILNAYQALEGHGELRITTRSESDPFELLVEIADNGPGIAEEKLEQVFSPFYTTKPSDKGTGLGLYISKTIIEQIGGSIKVQSASEEGTAFLVRLPAGD